MAGILLFLSFPMSAERVLERAISSDARPFDLAIKSSLCNSRGGKTRRILHHHLDIINDNIGGNVWNNQGQHHGSANGVRCGDESFGERHGDDDLVDGPFDRVTSLSALLPLQKVILASLACELGHTSPVFGRVSKITAADVWGHHLVH